MTGTAQVGAGYLAEEAGVSLRAIQVWSDAGILRARPATDRQGRGRHRLYDASPPLHGERTFALIAAELSKLLVPMGVMRRIIDDLREEVRRAKANPSAVELALRGVEVLLLFALNDKGGYAMWDFRNDMS